MAFRRLQLSDSAKMDMEGKACPCFPWKSAKRSCASLPASESDERSRAIRSFIFPSGRQYSPSRGITLTLPFKRRHSEARKDSPNQPDSFSDFIEHLAVVQSQGRDPRTMVPKNLILFPVQRPLRLGAMYTAINLNDQPHFRMVEIHDVTEQRYLTLEAILPNARPKNIFRLR